MTVTTRVPGRPDWTAGPLYQFLLDNLPAYITPLGVLDVQALKVPAERSHEAIYKWLRKGKLTPENARKVLEVMNGPKNVAALAENDRKPPKIEDFLPFM